MIDENQIYTVESNVKNNQQQNGSKEPGNSGKKYFYCGLITGLAVALLIVSGAYLANRIEAYITAHNNVASNATGENA